MQLFTVILVFKVSPVKKKYDNCRFGVDRTWFELYTAGVTRRGNTTTHVGSTFWCTNGVRFGSCRGVPFGTSPFSVWNSQKNKKYGGFAYKYPYTPGGPNNPLRRFFLCQYRPADKQAKRTSWNIPCSNIAAPAHAHKVGLTKLPVLFTFDVNVLMWILLAIPNKQPARISRQFNSLDIILSYRQKRTPPASDGAR